jgi:hypothetical protein
MKSSLILSTPEKLKCLSHSLVPGVLLPMGKLVMSTFGTSKAELLGRNVMYLSGRTLRKSISNVMKHTRLHYLHENTTWGCSSSNW